MKVVIASESPTKIEGVKAALLKAGLAADIVSVKAVSGVNEQPVGSTETEKGVVNREADARRQIPDADWYIAVEGGIFHERGKIVDRAVVLIHNGAGKGTIRYSDGVEFPKDAYDAALQEGLATTTVGQVMARDPQKYGVTAAYDPHAALSAHSRQHYIEQAVGHAINDMMVWRTRAADSHAASASVAV